MGTTGEPVPGEPGPVGQLPPDALFRYRSQAPGFGIRSRSRFIPPPDEENIVTAHDGYVDVDTRVTQSDPAAGRTQFPPQSYPASMGEGADRSPNEMSLGVDTVRQLRAGLIAQDRRGWEPQQGNGTRLADPIRQGEGPHGQTFRFLYSGLRREFMQDAQTFLGVRGTGPRQSGHGVHTRVVPDAKYSGYPRRMSAPRVYRLTERVQPPSYGSTTQVVGRGPGTTRAQAEPRNHQGQRPIRYPGRRGR